MSDIEVLVDEHGHLSLPDDLFQSSVHILSSNELQKLIDNHNLLVDELFALKSTFALHLFCEHNMSIEQVSSMSNIHPSILELYLKTEDD